MAKICWNIEVWVVQKTWKYCRSRQELFNEYLLAKFGVDTAENKPLKVHLIFKLRSMGFNFHRAAPPGPGFRKSKGWGGAFLAFRIFVLQNARSAKPSRALDDPLFYSSVFRWLNWGTEIRPLTSKIWRDRFWDPQDLHTLVPLWPHKFSEHSLTCPVIFHEVFVFTCFLTHLRILIRISRTWSSTKLFALNYNTFLRILKSWRMRVELVAK